MLAESEMKPEITLVEKTGDDAVLSKRISLDSEGALVKDGSQCRMAEGTARRVSVPTAKALADCIAGCASNQAITLGALRASLPARVRITVPGRPAADSDAITRSREFIDYLFGVPGWALIDFDTKGMPPEVAARIEAASGMWKALLVVAPTLGCATRVSRDSTSAGLFRTDTGEWLSGSAAATTMSWSGTPATSGGS